MRAFFVLVIFFLAFLLLVNSSIAEVDLTPNTSGIAQTTAPIAAPITSQPQVISIQQNPVTPGQSAVLLPVTGGCSDPHTVQSGDTLSQIAVNCNTTLAVLTQVNPQLINVNDIYPGQQIIMHSGSAAQLPVTGGESALPLLEAVTPVVVLPETCACFTASVPASGLGPMLIPGSELQVKAIHFPPNTPVNVAIGPRTAGYTVIASGVTDSNGNLTTWLTIPTAPDSQTFWVVVVVTTNPTPIQVMSQQFTIGQ